MIKIKTILAKILVWTCLTGVSLNVYAIDQEVKVDMLLSKITSSIKADRASDALPYFAEMEGMESTLTKPLPESFYYFYIEALSKVGQNDKTLSRADIYLSKFGKKGKYYSKVIEIITPIQIAKDKEEKRIAQENDFKEKERERKQKEYEEQLVKYEKDLNKRSQLIEQCKKDEEEKSERLWQNLQYAEVVFDRCNGNCTSLKKKAHQAYDAFWGNDKILRNYGGHEKKCESEISVPKEPVKP